MAGQPTDEIGHAERNQHHGNAIDGSDLALSHVLKEVRSAVADLKEGNRILRSRTGKAQIDWIRMAGYEEGWEMAPITALGCEYVADERSLSEPGTYDVDNPTAAIELVLDYLRQRLSAVFASWGQPPVLMLSGGIDSILIAAVTASLRNDAVAFTFQQSNLADSVQEAAVAAEVAADLGVEHHIVDPDAVEFRTTVVEVVERLGNTEPWEVLAGTVLLAIDRAAQARDHCGPIISGGGADALFLGGENIDAGLNDTELAAEWDQRLRSKVRKNFVRERFIPDFYERLIDDADRHIQVWQTHAATDLALRLHPTVVRGPHTNQDKAVFRLAAVELGVPERFVGLKKNPMQVSAGGIDSIVAIARAELARLYGEKTYSGPETEPLEFVVARMWLRSLER